MELSDESSSTIPTPPPLPDSAPTLINVYDDNGKAIRVPLVKRLHDNDEIAEQMILDICKKVLSRNQVARVSERINDFNNQTNPPFRYFANSTNPYKRPPSNVTDYRENFINPTKVARPQIPPPNQLLLKLLTVLKFCKTNQLTPVTTPMTFFLPYPTRPELNP